jgi:soluble lytic murein transglycosylase
MTIFRPSLRFFSPPLLTSFRSLSALSGLGLLTLCLGVLCTLPLKAQAQTHDAQLDDTFIDLAQAYKKADSRRVAALLPKIKGHPLEPWAAYWDLNLRLTQASPDEIRSFFAAYPNSYQADRLRNDWLLQLGAQRDWPQFEREYPLFRMNDDRNVRCYALWAQYLRDQRAVSDEFMRLWTAQHENEEGCAFVAENLFKTKQLKPTDVWRKARLATEANKPRSAHNSVVLFAPKLSDRVKLLFKQTARAMGLPSAHPSEFDKELAVLSLLRLADKDPQAAAARLSDHWLTRLTPEELTWTWGAIGKSAARRLSDQALDYFSLAPLASINDEHSVWRVRAALRAGKWRQVLQGTQALSDDLRREPTWVYWRARALLATDASDAAKAEANKLFSSIASARGFYEQLALEELGSRITTPSKPSALTADEVRTAQTNPSLIRALYALQLGLRAEGVREWNFATNLAKPGGMNDRELLAAATLACEHQVWDRCINTSERTRSQWDWSSRYPTPLRELIDKSAKDQGLEPAYVFGLIRQESRFISDAKSVVGAAGFMQVMPKTAQWTAKKMGLAGYTRDKLYDPSVNIAIGTAYLKLVLDDMQGSLPMAAAAYNAGPGRPRQWRQGPVLEAAIWAENIPFGETRDYVKKVLSNTTNYAALLTGQPQSLKERLGKVGPKDASAPVDNTELP